MFQPNDLAIFKILYIIQTKTLYDKQCINITSEQKEL